MNIYEILLTGDPDTWQLVIDPVLSKDAALYECQVNTRDKMSLVFKLNVQREFDLSLKCPRISFQ